MTLHGDTLKSAIGQTRDKWGWFVGLGVVLLILGGIAFG
ncbi:HdeD family acid-resistance protein, partial [Mesorhizobium sp. M1C.F.Ca.ET.189.01.1.1]